MRGKILFRHLTVAASAGVLLFLALGAAARPQQDEGPKSPGPNPGVGDTVLVPKKTPPPSPGSAAPGSDTQPATKKPEKIDPNEVFTLTMEPKDWVAVVTFDLNQTILTDFTQSRQEVLQAINMLHFPGFSETNLFDSLAFTIDRMKDIQGRKAIVVVCTGIDTFSKLTYDQTLKLVRNSDTTIYPISILEWADVRMAAGTGITGAQARATLTYISKYSGGQAYFPRFEQDLPSIYEQIAQQLRSQYSLGFIPTNSTRDGKFRKIKVDLVDERGNPLIVSNEKGKNVKYKVVSREGYYAPKS